MSYSPFNPNGVTIVRYAGAVHFSYLLSSADDIELELSLPESEIPDFLARNGCATLDDVDCSVLIDECW